MNKHTEIWLKFMRFAKKYCRCHQIADRSFFFYGYQFPLCSRCTGIVVGYFTSIILSVCGCVFPIELSLVLIIPIIIDGSIQFFLNIMSNNKKRFATGFLYGIGFIQIISVILTSITNKIAHIPFV